MQAERIGSHFSHNGPINFISRLDCYICKDASKLCFVSEREMLVSTSKRLRPQIRICSVLSPQEGRRKEEDWLRGRALLRSLYAWQLAVLLASK